MASNSQHRHDEKTNSRAELVAEAVRISILEGVTKHHDRLDARIIADRYTVNIAVAEVAVRKLVIEGFARKFESYVDAVSMSPDELLRFTSDRSRMEGMLFEDIMPKKSQRELDEILDVVQRGLNSKTRREFITADIKIFRLMYRQQKHWPRPTVLMLKRVYHKYDRYSWIDHKVARENLFNYCKVIELCKTGEFEKARGVHMNYLWNSSIVIYKAFWKKLMIRFSNE